MHACMHTTLSFDPICVPSDFSHILSSPSQFQDLFFLNSYLPYYCNTYTSIHTHTYVYKYNVLSIAHMCMCLKLVSWDWKTYRRLVPGGD